MLALLLPTPRVPCRWYAKRCQVRTNCQGEKKSPRLPLLHPLMPPFTLNRPEELKTAHRRLGGLTCASG